MINDVNFISKCFVYDFYHKNSYIEDLSLEDTQSFFISARRSFGAFIKQAHFYYDDLTKLAHDRLCAALKGKEETYILISFNETVRFKDEEDEVFTSGHEAKICLHENEDGTIYLQGEMIDEDEYNKKLGNAYDEFEKPVEYCPRCEKPVIFCECTGCYVCSELDCICPKCPECDQKEIFCECGYDWETSCDEQRYSIKDLY